MAKVHPSAVVEGHVELAGDVSVGPWCILDGTLGPVSVGPGTTLIAHVYLQGPLTLGAVNALYPGVCLGFAPQSLSYDPAQPGLGLVIGDRNTFREGVTVHRAMTDHGPTTIGNRTYFMGNTHAGHDARIADDVVIANGTVLGGHVQVDDRVTIGGNASIHQFVHIGRGAMISGAMGITGNLPPFFMLTGTNLVGAVNLVGMRRMGMSKDEIEDARWVFRTLYRRGLPLPDVLRTLRERADRPLVAEYIAFIESSKRPICHGYGQVRGRLPADIESAAPPVVT